ncbi:hypothetical protein MJ561_22195 [Klebsiella pneumoniae]|nr:hypothetical protein MJ561_22195 [Klebsiella pneumoniae]
MAPRCRWWIVSAFCRLSADGEACPPASISIWGSSWSGESAAAGGIWLRAARYHRGGVLLRWIRRPPQAAWDPAHSLLQAWLSLAWPARILVLGLAFALGLAMPLMGASACCCSLPLTTQLARGNGTRMMKSSD